MTLPTIAHLTPWITEAAACPAAHADLPALLMQHLGIGRRSALLRLRALVAAQWLVRSGSTRRPRWHPGPLRQIVRSYELAGLQEDAPWRQDFAPFFELPAEVARMARHAFTELLNNAVDHSRGSSVTVSMRQTALQLQLLISDDGCGVFQRVADRTGIGEPTLAMFELSKGRLSSTPERHSGQGLYFCSRLADVFDLHANGSAFQCRHWEPKRWRPGRAIGHAGTSVYLALALDTERTLDAVLRSHAVRADGLAFERTVVPLHLLASAGHHVGTRAPAPVELVSRAEARRVLSGLAGFAQADLDFSGVDDIGPGFVDELLRVSAGSQGRLKLATVGASPRVRERLAAFDTAA